MSSSITPQDKKKYVLKTERDVDILLLCKQLEKKKLSQKDRATVKLIKSQLIDDWRKPLEQELNKLTKKYQ